MIHSLLARSFALLLPVSTLLAANPFPGEKTDHHGAALYSLQIGTERNVTELRLLFDVFLCDRGNGTFLGERIRQLLAPRVRVNSWNL